MRPPDTASASAHAGLADYDLPPLPPPPESATPSERYYGELLQWQTRALDGRLRHSAIRASTEREVVVAGLADLRAEMARVRGAVDDLDDAKRGACARALAALAKLPQPVQLSLAATVGPVLAALIYQLSGAAIEEWTGRALPPPPPVPEVVPVESP